MTRVIPALVIGLGLLWSTQALADSTLSAGEQLQRNEFLSSNSARFRLILQGSDGNVVLRDMTTGTALWSTRTNGTAAARLTLQASDGNLVLRASNGSSLWSSGTSRSGAVRLVMQDDGNLQLFNAAGTSVWSTKTRVDETDPDDPDTDPGVPCPTNLYPSGGRLTSGPVVGHTTSEAAKIWAYAPDARDLRVVYWRRGACTEPSQALAMGDNGGGTSLAKLSGLRTNTTYDYLVLAGSLKAAQGSFTTAPAPGQPKRFRYVFGSCMNVNKYPVQPVWDHVLDQEPAFQIFNGDTVYADTTDYARIWAKHMQQRAVTNFAEALRNIPTYSTWDDHDYANNDSDGTASGKENSLRAFTRLWPNPGFGTPSTPGVFYTFSWANVQFFVMDNRYHRFDGSYIGTQQMAWLTDGLRKSQAAFKIIVHGGTIRRAGPESWFERSSERGELLGFIRANAIRGVLFHGGDVHQNLFNPYPKCPSTGKPQYDVFELVSSGLTNDAAHTLVEVDTSGKPTLKYTFFEDGENRETGILTVETDGTMKHTLISRDGAADEVCQELPSSSAYPR